MKLSAYIAAHPITAKLTTGEKNLLVKLDGFGLTVDENPAPTVNYISGLVKTLDPLNAALVAFCLRSYDNYMRSQGQFSWMGHKFPVSIFDRTKYLVLKLDSQAYYDFID